MKKVASLCLALLFTLGFFFVHPNKVRADSNFSISLQSTYSVVTSGNTFVEQKFELTNNTPTYYAKDYAVEFGSSKLKNVRVSDTQGAIPANIVTTDSKTSVGITFRDQIVGEGKSRVFTITFENPDSAQVSGNVLEVDIPKLSQAADYVKYTVFIKTPLQYGKPVRVTPSDYSTSEDDKDLILQFSNLGEQSISLLFGDKQVFDFTVINNVENPTSNLGVIQLALPPDTARQKVNYISLDPPPKEMSRDGDGNWIATYEVAAQKNLNVSLTGKVMISLDNKQLLDLPEPNSQLTQPQPYWESSSSQISQLAKTLNTPRLIYDYVVQHLSYNYQREENATTSRLGAVGVLANPSDAVCQEFTDLFIALARANQIPARRAVGYAYTANSRLRPLGFVRDTLHTWPEYFDQEKKEWIPVDPTWGDTTGGINYFDQFDFNHIVFSINGASSSLPYAAGSYRKERQISNNVEVKFGNDMDLPKPSFNFELVRKSIWQSVLNPQYTLRITNNTGVAWYNIPIQLLSDNPAVQVRSSVAVVDYLLPYQTREVFITAVTPQKWRAYPFRLTVLVDSLSSTYDLNTSLSFQGALAPNVIAIGLVGGVVIAAALSWSVLVSRRSRYRALRRKSERSQK